jgi:cytochrome P450
MWWPTLLSFDPFRRSYQEDPYPSLARLRRAEPISRSRQPDGWVLTRHEDCRETLRDNVRFSNDPTRGSGDLARFVVSSRHRSPIGDTAIVGSSDPPVHTRLRSIVSRLFTTRTVQAARPRIRQHVEQLLGEATASGSFDLMSSIARPLPSLIVGDLLGLTEEERAPVRDWTRALMRVIGGGDLPSSAYREAETATKELRDFLDRYADTHEGEGTILGELIAAEQDEERLSLQETVAFLAFLYQAGGGPTSMMLGNAVLTLLRHREQWELLRDRPDLPRQAVVETLRWDSATHVLLRFVVEQHTIGRRRLEPGDSVFVNVAAAHRDPEVFVDPDRFDITRRTDTGEILSFGIGPHFCLGQPLALIQAEELVRALTERLPKLAIAPSGLAREQDLLLRGPRRLELSVG